MQVTIGVDIGQKRDPTAICVAEKETRTEDGRHRIHFLVRFLQRLPLGTPYPEVVRRVDRIVGGVRKRDGAAPLIYVDATGVGTPIVDLLQSEARNIQEVYAVYFTHGDRRTEKRKDRYWQVSLGKALLVSRLQALLQTARIHLPGTPEARALAQELMNFEIRVDENANDKYGAFKVGTHDDLVTALGLAVQTDQQGPVSGGMWDPGW